MTESIADLMAKLPAAFQPAKAGGIEAVVHFKLTGAEPGEWNAVIRNGQCVVAQGLPHFRPTIAVSADSADLVRIMSGELDGTQAFMAGRIKVAGDMNSAMKILELFKP